MNPNLISEVSKAYRSNPYPEASVSLGEALALAELVSEYKPERTLEIGLAQAASAIAIIQARKSVGIKGRHICLDPYQRTHAEELGLIELRKHDLMGDVDWREVRSECFFSGRAPVKDTAIQVHGQPVPLMIWGEPAYDFIFIDGGHTIGQAVCDAFWSYRFLAVGGIIAIHDAFMFSTAASARYLIDECKMAPVPLGRPGVKRWARCLKYAPRIGRRYALSVLPWQVDNLIVLRKEQEVSPDGY